MTSPNQSLVLQLCDEARDFAYSQSTAFRMGRIRSVELDKGFKYEDEDLYNTCLAKDPILDETRFDVSFRAKRFAPGKYSFSILSSLSVTSSVVPPEIFVGLSEEDQEHYAEPDKDSVVDTFIQEINFDNFMSRLITIGINRECTVGDEEIYSDSTISSPEEENGEQVEVPAAEIFTSIEGMASLFMPYALEAEAIEDEYERTLIGSVFEDIMLGNEIEGQNDLISNREAFRIARFALSTIKRGYPSGCEGFTVELARPIEDYMG